LSDKEIEISNSVEASFPNFGFVLLMQHQILILDDGLVSFNRSLSRPYVSFSPLQLAFEIFPDSKFVNVARHAKILPKFSFIMNFERELVLIASNSFLIILNLKS